MSFGEEGGYPEDVIPDSYTLKFCLESTVGDGVERLAEIHDDQVDLATVIQDNVEVVGQICQLCFARTPFSITSYVDEWYLFRYQWKENTHGYALVANIRVYRTFSIENSEGGFNNPFGGRITENGSGGRGLTISKKLFYKTY